MPDSAAQDGEVLMAAKNNTFGFSSEAVDHMYYRYHWLVKTGKPMVWESFQDFMLWCKGTYSPGTTLRRIDEDKPYGPNNCKWEPMQTSEEYKKKMAAKWDSIMAPIRERYAQSLREVEEKKTQYFRYEHPDLVREGIVFNGS
jgi:hypothetical protein